VWLMPRQRMCMADASMTVVLHYIITITMDFTTEQRELYRFILADGEKMERKKMPSLATRMPCHLIKAESEDTH